MHFSTSDNRYFLFIKRQLCMRPFFSLFFQTHMAVVPICYKMSYKDHVPKVTIQNERSMPSHFIAIQEGYRCLSSISIDKNMTMHHSADCWLKSKTRNREADKLQGTASNSKPKPLQTMKQVFPDNTRSKVNCYSEYATQNEKSCTAIFASKSNASEKQLKLLDSYFGKLQNEVNRKQNSTPSSRDSMIASKAEEHRMEPSSISPDEMIILVDRSGQVKAKKELESLDDYLGKLKKGTDSRKYKRSSSDDKATQGIRERVSDSGIGGYGRRAETKMTSSMQLGSKDDERGPESFQIPHPYDETSDLYLISILVSMNIAVFLFEIASPIRNADLEYLSLPLIYGAKINHLILVGEWWRLVTPMFLHSGFLHVALSCWVLLKFGPQVCRAYGSFTFILIYVLGGISGNLISFLHTPEPTVGGTGPVFAIIGAWLVYQIQSKEAIAKEASESMLQKAAIATAFSCILSNFGPIDNWTDLGAACVGIAYGFITCSTLQSNDSTSKRNQEEGIALVRRYPSPWRSVLAFTLFILFLSSLLLFLEPPLNSLELNSY